MVREPLWQALGPWHLFWRWLVIRSNSRIAWVNHITTVKLTSVIRNAPIVVRNMYRPIDPIGLDFPAAATPDRPAPRTPVGVAKRSPKAAVYCFHKMASPRQSL